MSVSLEGLLRQVGDLDQSNERAFSTLAVPGYQNFLVGKDSERRPCVLVAAPEYTGTPRAPIRLQNVDVRFALLCWVGKRGEGAQRRGRFTVVRCLSADPEMAKYFLSICETLIGLLGDNPGEGEVAVAVHRLVEIFRAVRDVPKSDVIGLFGEMFLIARSREPTRAVTAWRNDPTASFDFSEADLLIDVKTTCRRVRIHRFSYEQCNPPRGASVFIASVLTERCSGGTTIQALFDRIVDSVDVYPDLVLKVHEVVAGTLGKGRRAAMDLAFDEELAESKLRFFDAHRIPAVRESLPASVSEVRFRVDLSCVNPVKNIELRRTDSVLMTVSRRDLTDSGWHE